MNKGNLEFAKLANSRRDINVSLTLLMKNKLQFNGILFEKRECLFICLLGVWGFGLFPDDFGEEK